MADIKNTNEMTTYTGKDVEQMDHYSIADEMQICIVTIEINVAAPQKVRN